MDRDSLISPRDVQALVADGGNVLKLDGWINKHPGGYLVIHRMGKV
jgi:delta8-fatty-acid desaturase